MIGERFVSLFHFGVQHFTNHLNSNPTQCYYDCKLKGCGITLLLKYFEPNTNFREIDGAGKETKSKINKLQNVY